ncbi:hypothetical protein IHE44_0000474 [Lamprotornis superbus]|uniref:Ribosomal RNA-processing protein 42 n=1 Tax=Lamprotornis superbus TaxID=245042 RepID=A0A835NQJ5_9PASS|nr:hypothetical protein IHE44_0000474 [Lamprotornis superbus]
MIAVNVKKFFTGPANPKEANQQKLNNENSSSNSPELEGRGGEELGTDIANTLYRVFSCENSVDLKSLCINPKEHCWVLYVDVLLLECGGNIFDAISIAVKAALFNTRIPKVRVLEDEEGTKEIELSDDPYDCIRLNVDEVPCIVTLSKIGYRHVVDATLQEEACSLASLLISVTSKGAITSMKKVGKGSLDPESIFEMMETGQRVGKSLHIALQKILDEEESLGASRPKSTLDRIGAKPPMDRKDLPACATADEQPHHPEK